MEREREREKERERKREREKEILRKDVVSDDADSVAHEAEGFDFTAGAQRRRPEEGAAHVGHFQPRTDDIHVGDLTRRQR